MTTSSSAPGVALSPKASSGRLGTRGAVALVVSAIVVFLAASSAPSPLYGVYREAWGFSALTLTVVFASYAFALVAALLVFGSLSDHLGRRTVILAALLLEIGAVLLFWRAESVGWLLAARVLQGLATGMASSVLSAALIDLDARRAALLNGLAPMLGMAVGALGAAAMVEYLPHPTRHVFELLLVVLAVQVLLAWRLPETARPRPGAWRSLLPRVHVPAAARRLLLRLLPLNTAGWALGGFYLSLGPTLAQQVTGRHTPLAGGLLIALLVAMGAFSIFRVRERAPLPTLRTTALWLVAGLAVTLGGIASDLPALLFLGTAMAGLGFGGGFVSSVRLLVPTAQPHERAGLMASFYVVSYLAFSVPAILAGLAVGVYGLKTAALGYGALLILLGLWSYAIMRPRA